jgi:hypothetical protein
VLNRPVDREPITFEAYRKRLDGTGVMPPFLIQHPRGRAKLSGRHLRRSDHGQAADHGPGVRRGLYRPLQGRGRWPLRMEAGAGSAPVGSALHASSDRKYWVLRRSIRLAQELKELQQRIGRDPCEAATGRDRTTLRSAQRRARRGAAGSSRGPTQVA